MYLFQTSNPTLHISHFSLVAPIFKESIVLQFMFCDFNHITLKWIAITNGQMFLSLWMLPASRSHCEWISWRLGVEQGCVDLMVLTVWQLNRSFSNQKKEKWPLLQPAKQHYRTKQQYWGNWFCQAYYMRKEVQQLYMEKCPSSCLSCRLLSIFCPKNIAVPVKKL